MTRRRAVTARRRATIRPWRLGRSPSSLRATFLASAVAALVLGWAVRAEAIERNFAGSAQLDYFLVPEELGRTGPRNAFDGFTSEIALKVAVDVSEHLSANVKVCHGCHGFELAMAYFDYRVADELNVRVGRFSPSFGSFNVRHDPANHAASSKPLPYDMGRMLRPGPWNLGVLPSPFPDNGVEVGGTHWFQDRAQLDYAAYAVSGFKQDQRQIDIDWSQSISQSAFLTDNNGVPAVGGRLALTFRMGEANDLTTGASVMYGTYDARNRVAYLIAGGDVAARIGRTQIRAEYLVRHQSFEAAPGVEFLLPVPVSGPQVFDKHGAYLEVEHAVNDTLGLLVRVDGLYRAGNVTTDSSIGTRSAIFRYTLGGTIAVAPGLRIKLSTELWAFSDNVPVHEDLEIGFHAAAVGTF